MLSCKDCIAYAMCRSKIINYLCKYHYEPYSYNEIYRAYYFEISSDCTNIREKCLNPMIDIYEYDNDRLVDTLLEELSLLGDLYICYRVTNA